MHNVLLIMIYTSLEECEGGVLKNKTVLVVTHQVDFLHNVDLILVMRDGMIVQAGKYNDLLNSGLNFKELVAAHETSIELVEMSTTIPSKSSPSPQISPQLSSNHREANGGNNSSDQPKSDNRTSKLIKEEEKETGKVSLHVYKASTDQTNINQFLPFILGMTIAMYITVLAIFIVVCQNSWPTVFLLIPLIWLNIWYRIFLLFGFWGYYLASSHELTRLDSITKAPVIHHFSESISGVIKIRRGPSQLCVGIIKTVMQVQVKPPLDLWQEVANLLQLPPTFLHSV
ncbi:hypothetical protein CerSpe_296360 [Prunus speciosa]